MSKRTWYTCQQPSFFPPLYIVQRATIARTWVLFNEAQFDRYHTTCLLMDRQGRELKLSVPVKKPRLKRFDEVCLSEWPFFVTKMKKQVQSFYGGGPEFDSKYEWFCGLLDSTLEYEKLTDLCTRVAVQTFAWLRTEGVMKSPKMVDSRSLIGHRPTCPTEWIANSGLAIGATDYVQGTKSIESYFDARAFEHTGITVHGQKYSCAYGKPTRDASYSILDAMFSLTSEELRKILQVGRNDTLVPMKKSSGGTKFERA